MSYGRQCVLDSVSLEIYAGDSLVLIGPSGQGKTTLLKILAGLTPPVEGQVFIDEKDFYKSSTDDRLQVTRKFGMLFQKNALFDSMSVYENVAFPLRELTRDSESEIKDKVEFYLKAVGLEHVPQNQIHEISGGMQKRLGIARALVLSPQVVFYDDPTAGLDPITSRKIVDLILELKDQMNSTIVSITNEMARAFQLAECTADGVAGRTTGRIAMVVDQNLVELGDKNAALAHEDQRVFQFVRGLKDGPLSFPMSSANPGLPS